MALTWIEDGESRSATIARKGRKAQSSYRKSWKVFGTQDDSELHTDINAKITASYAYWQYPGVAGMQLRAESYSVAYLGDDAWQVSVDYVKDGAEDGEDPLKRSRSFDTTGGTQHITQGHAVGLRELDFASEGEGFAPVFERRFPTEAPDQEGAIAVDDNGVNGVDITVPQLQWQEGYDVPNAYVTNNYVRVLTAMTGTVNNASFRGFAAGEVLFLGCIGSQEWDDQRGRGPWSLTYRFVASPNVVSQTIGSITGIDKKGHEYLWVRYQSVVDSSTLIKRPLHVYVNKVYPDGNFSALGIGTT